MMLHYIKSRIGKEGKWYGIFQEKEEKEKNWV